MHIDPGGDIGLEVHTDGDQFLRIEAGRARVQMGPSRDDLTFDRDVEGDWVILVPAGSWHNVTNGYHGVLGAVALLGKVLILPGSWLLRLPEDDASAHLFRNHYLEVAAFVTTGLPFVFFVIALRNFMAAADRSVR